MEGLLTIRLSVTLFFCHFCLSLFGFIATFAAFLWLKYFAIRIRLSVNNFTSYILRLSISYDIIS